MKRKIICLLWLSLPLFCMAQLPIEYEYDEAGNRTSRKVIRMLAPPLVPPPPASPDSVMAALLETEEQLMFLPPSPNSAVAEPAETEALMSLMSQDLATTEPLVPEPSPEYFVEKVAQVEIKIYPNPTTEKITLEISNMENLQTGVFKLFSITGQFLQEQSVHSATTIVSLAGLPKGAYILKVHINGIIEDWKVVKI